MIFSLWRTFNISVETKAWSFCLALADITEAKQRKIKSVKLFSVFVVQPYLGSGGTGVWYKTAVNAVQVVLEEKQEEKGYYLFPIAQLDYGLQ